jgi:hypothetical protein
LADVDAELQQFAVNPGRTPERGSRCSFAESDHEARDPLMAALISNASAKTGESLDDAIGRRWPA